ncbi:hypothetical protein ILUMI_15641, partial [Ignelater luminosus]
AAANFLETRQKIQALNDFAKHLFQKLDKTVDNYDAKVHHTQCPVSIAISCALSTLNDPSRTWRQSQLVKTIKSLKLRDIRLSMITGATVKELGRHCSFHCHSSTATIISEVDDDIFVITHCKRNTVITCSATKYHFDDTAYEKPGALQIELPRDCFLSILSESIDPTDNDPNQLSECCLVSGTDSHSQLQRFWELQDCPSEWSCELNFINTTYKDETGRFIVSGNEKNLTWAILKQLHSTGFIP